MLTHNQETLLTIVRWALWQEELPLTNAEWKVIEELAKQQAVSWMLYPGIKSSKDSIPMTFFESGGVLPILAIFTMIS